MVPVLVVSHLWYHLKDVGRLVMKKFGNFITHRLKSFTCKISLHEFKIKPLIESSVINAFHASDILKHECFYCGKVKYTVC